MLRAQAVAPGAAGSGSTCGPLCPVAGPALALPACFSVAACSAKARAHAGGSPDRAWSRAWSRACTRPLLTSPPPPCRRFRRVTCSWPPGTACSSLSPPPRPRPRHPRRSCQRRGHAPPWSRRSSLDRDSDKDSDSDRTLRSGARRRLSARARWRRPLGLSSFPPGRRPLQRQPPGCLSAQVSRPTRVNVSLVKPATVVSRAGPAAPAGRRQRRPLATRLRQPPGRQRPFDDGEDALALRWQGRRAPF